MHLLRFTNRFDLIANAYFTRPHHSLTAMSCIYRFFDLFGCRNHHITRFPLVLVNDVVSKKPEVQNRLSSFIRLKHIDAKSLS